MGLNQDLLVLAQNRRSHMDLYPKHPVGTIRKRRRFVIRKTIGKTTLYLQTATWEEKYVHVFVASYEDHYEWEPKKFIF